MALRDFCLACKAKNLTKIIDLGMHSYADRFISKENYSKSDPVFPLTCSICNNCGIIQNDIVTPPEDRYQSLDYSYTASNSKFSINYWEQYAKEICTKLNNGSKDCLEIGSNDGTLLEFFKDNGLNVTGVDASPLMVSLSQKKGLDAYCGIFGLKNSNKVSQWENKKYDLIIANNVLNHSDDPLSFCQRVEGLFKDNDSFFVFEQPYWKDLVEMQSFDQIYHEHVLYFTAKNAINLMELSGLEVFKIEHKNYHGGSIRVYASKKGCKSIDKSVDDFVKKESEFLLEKNSTYLKLMNILKNKKIKTLEKILKALNDKRPIICLGAAAKANTLLTYYGLNSSIIDFITDTSPFKVDKYTPLTRIPIKKDEDIANLKNPLCLITSWNLSEQILLKLKQINPTAEFISAHDI